jgi:hypothetical protein
MCVIFLPFSRLIIIYVFLLLSRESPKGDLGEPPPDVMSGENVTLSSSVIALRREAITPMIFSPFFPSLFFAFHSIRFSFNKMLRKN